MTLADTENGFKNAKKVVDISTQWMTELGHESLAETVSKASASFDILCNVYKVAGVASALMGTKNAMATEEAVALTSVFTAMGPAGWGRIALAGGAMATGYAVTSSILNRTIRGDLSNPSGIEAVRQQIGEVM